MNRFQEPPEEWFVQTLKLQTDHPLKNPSAFTFDENEDLIVCDSGNCLVRKIHLADGTLNVSNVSGILGDKSGKDGTLDTATFALTHISCIACHSNGTLFVSQLFGALRRISVKENSVTTVHQYGVGTMIRGLYLRDDLLMVSCANQRDPKIQCFKVVENGIKFSYEIATAEEDNMYYTPNRLTSYGQDYYFTCWPKHSIMKLVDGGILTCFTELESAGYKDGYINKALFSTPSALVADAHGNLYICDRDNNRIRKVHTKRRIVKTIAGNEKKETIDGFNTEAAFDGPTDIVLSKRGVFFVLQLTGEVRMLQSRR